VKVVRDDPAADGGGDGVAERGRRVARRAANGVV